MCPNLKGPMIYISGFQTFIEHNTLCCSNNFQGALTFLIFSFILHQIRNSYYFTGSELDNLPSTCIKFALGVPNVSTFPFKKISVKLITGENIELQDEELSIALQYLPSQG